MIPYFNWIGADGTSILTINLFGGYRNLYGISHVPEVAVRRLTAEITRLEPYYPTPDIPLFDGYDLEDKPEDPLAFYDRYPPGPGYALNEATPASFASLVANLNLDLPSLNGELNSGKFGATFPGTFSARTYLKIMASDCADLLFRRCEPLAALAGFKGQTYPDVFFEQAGRLLLQNGVHDCICGVSIDQVHEKMAISYRQVFDQLLSNLKQSLAFLLHDFQEGDYAISTNLYGSETWETCDGSLVRLKTDGLGIWPVAERFQLEEVSKLPQLTENFVWANEFYEAQVLPDGLVRIGQAVLGELRVYAEHGDTYSDERGELLGVMRLSNPPRLVERSARHAVLELDYNWTGSGIQVSARVRLVFDPSPLVKWKIHLDSSGTDFSVQMIFFTGRQGAVWAGMPFDLVERGEVDTDLLPSDPGPDLAKILLGQREIGEVRTFPMHEMAAVEDTRGTSVVFARGLHAYQADAGTLSLTLHRSVSWLTRKDLKSRLGDAGPLFYVPDASCEREVQHELAFAVFSGRTTSTAVQAVNAAFQNPPLLVRREGSNPDGRCEWLYMQEDLPLASLHMLDDIPLVRVYNPSNEPVRLTTLEIQTDVRGRGETTVHRIESKKIATMKLTHTQKISPVGPLPQVWLHNTPQWRVGPNHGRPEPKELNRLDERIDWLMVELAQSENKPDQVSPGSENDLQRRLHLRHQQYILQRELLENRLSRLLNQRKLAAGGSTPPIELFSQDPEIAALGRELNDLRIHRRIYDYVVQVLD